MPCETPVILREVWLHGLWPLLMAAILGSQRAPALALSDTATGGGSLEAGSIRATWPRSASRRIGWRQLGESTEATDLRTEMAPQTRPSPSIARRRLEIPKDPAVAPVELPGGCARNRRQPQAALASSSGLSPRGEGSWNPTQIRRVARPPLAGIVKRAADP